MLPLGIVDKLYINKNKKVNDLYTVLLQPEDFIIDSQKKLM